jgi:superfamily I DNA/RNA helicase
VIETFDDPEQEAEAVRPWIAGRVEQGVQPHEIGVFVRSTRELRRGRAAVKSAGIPAVELSDRIEITPGKLSIGTMHLAKGLEFRAVAVMACDDEVIPSRSASRMSPTMPISKTFTTVSAICFTWRAPAPAMTCS